MVRGANLLDILMRQLFGAAVDEVAKITRVDEEDFALARVAVAAGTVHKPEGCRYLCVQEQFGGQVDDTVDEVAVRNERLADVAFAAGLAGEGAFGEHHACSSIWGEVVDEVLQPSEVGVARWRRAIFPAAIVAQQFTTPVADVERRVGDDEIGLEVFVRVVEEGAFVVPLHLRGVDAADGEVHLGQPPSGLVAFLAVDGDVVDAALVFFDELFRLHEHAARAAAGIEHTAFVGFQHGDQQFDNAARRIELPALLAFGQREFAEEVFEHMAQHIGAARLGIAERDVAHQVDQAAEAGRVEVLPRKHLGQHTLEDGVFLFDGIHRCIDMAADVGLLGFHQQERPARLGRDEEDVLGSVFVLVLGIGSSIVAFALLKPSVHLLERVGDVFQEDQPEHYMLVFCSVDILAQLAGGFPELLF